MSQKFGMIPKRVIFKRNLKTLQNITAQNTHKRGIIALRELAWGELHLRANIIREFILSFNKY